jgi:hypothetical protein
MAFVITLTAEDAERIGVPTRLELDLDKLMGRELIAMERVTRWSYEALQQGMSGRPAVDAIGQPIFETEDDGVTRKKDPAGNPIQVTGFDLELLLVIAWLACRRAKGEEVDWATFDIDVNGAEFDGDDEGKAPAPNRAQRRASKTGTTTTKPRSRTRSTSPHGTSATG